MELLRHNAAEKPQLTDRHDQSTSLNAHVDTTEPSNDRAQSQKASCVV